MMESGKMYTHMDNLKAHMLSLHGLNDRRKQHVVVVFLHLPGLTHVELPHECLSYNKTYQLLQNNATHEIGIQFIEYLRACKELGVITTHEYNRIVLSIKKKQDRKLNNSHESVQSQSKDHKAFVLQLHLLLDRFSHKGITMVSYVKNFCY